MAIDLFDIETDSELELSGTWVVMEKGKFIDVPDPENPEKTIREKTPDARVKIARHLNDHHVIGMSKITDLFEGKDDKDIKVLQKKRVKAIENEADTICMDIEGYMYKGEELTNTKDNRIKVLNNRKQRNKIIMAAMEEETFLKSKIKEMEDNLGES